MAIVVSGTKCLLCEKPMTADQKVVGFPPFVGNELDPLRIFSDRAFHAECFNRHPLSEKALARYEEIRQRMGPPRYCTVCQRKIEHPDEYFGLTYFTDEKGDPLYQYNFVRFHRSCLVHWPALPQVIRLIEDFQDSGRWKGKGLELLLNELNKIYHSNA